MSVKRRPTNEGLDALNASVGVAQEALERAERVVSLKDHTGWREVQEMIQSRISGVERRLEDFEKMDPEGRLLSLKERQVLRMFERIVDDFERAIPDLTEALNKAVEARDGYKERLGS